jgi:hypothetical protein
MRSWANLRSQYSPAQLAAEARDSSKFETTRPALGSSQHSLQWEQEALLPDGKSSSQIAPLQWVKFPYALILLNIHENFFSTSREIADQKLPLTAS